MNFFSSLGTLKKALHEIKGPGVLISQLKLAPTIFLFRFPFSRSFQLFEFYANGKVRDAEILQSDEADSGEEEGADKFGDG